MNTDGGGGDEEFRSHSSSLSALKLSLAKNKANWISAYLVCNISLGEYVDPFCRMPVISGWNATLKQKIVLINEFQMA